MYICYMSLRILIVYILASSLIFFHCAVKKTTSARPASPNSAELREIKSQPNQTATREDDFLAAAETIEQGATKEWLVQGKDILNNQCAVCHKAKDPIKYDEANWFRHMNRMIPKAKLTEEQAKYLRVYTLSQFRVVK